GFLKSGNTHQTRKNSYNAILYPPKNTNKPSLTPLCPCLKAPFGHQKVHAKPFFTHILDDITHENNNLSGSDYLESQA
ncbi:MAG: hypothetical protein QM498_15615, partial [Desulfobacterium sp.]